MAKVEFDPIVNGIRNRVGNFVYSKWKGRNVIRRYNPGSRNYNETQKGVQTAFSDMVKVWKLLPVLMRGSWKAGAAGKAVSEYNLFIGYNVKKRIAGEPLRLSCAMGLENPRVLTVAPGKAGQADVTVEPMAANANLTVAIQKIVEGKGESSIEMRYDQYKGSSPVTIDGLESGADYFVYCMITDRAFAESEKISESAGFRITVA